MFTNLIAASLIPGLLLTQVNYDYPDNSHLPSNRFFQEPMTRDSKYQGISKRLIPWSKYQGVKNNTKTIHPNRQIVEFLFVACRANQDGSRKHFYTAIDAEKYQQLVMNVVQSGRQFSQPPC